jgi:transposase
VIQQDESRAIRYRRYQAIRLLLARGLSERAISRLLNLTRATVHKYATNETFLERAALSPHPSILDPYLPYLQQQVQAGETNARQLWREIQVQGYPGAYQQVARVVRYYRDLATHPIDQTQSPNTIQQAPPVTFGPLPSARQLVWFLLRPTEDLPSDEQWLLAQLRQHPLVEMAYQLTRQFQSMLRLRQADKLQAWLDNCRSSNLPDLQTFAAGLQREFPSIYQALAGPWSNGTTEGHVNRLKLIKRTMFGRANFDLLRIRVLASST